MMTKFDRRLTYLIKQLQNAFRVRIDACLKDMDITAMQYTVMCWLRGREGWSSASLARRHLVTPQTMNQLIGSLERRDLIRRKVSPTNRRILLVTLSDEGRRLLAECDKRMDRLETEMFGHLPPHVMASLYHNLADLVERLRDPKFDSIQPEAVSISTEAAE